MSFWKNLFGGSKRATAFEPDNTRLMQLLTEHGRSPSTSLAQEVHDELNGPHAYLLVASDGSLDQGEGWRTIQKGAKLKLASVFDVDGLKVLGAWTDEDALVQWSKRATPYTSMPAKALLEMCEEWRIGRVVINSDLPTMFVLQGPGERFDTRTIKQETRVQVGTPSRPLEPRILARMAEEFKGVTPVMEAFHYAQSTKEESVLMVGLKLDPTTDEARLAALQAIHDALKGEILDQTLDVFVISSEDWYQTLSGISNSRFYRRA